MPSKYQMWMTYNGETEKLRFPVLPEALNIQKGARNQSVDIQGLGEVVVKQDPAAIVITFSSFFPAQPFPGVQFEDLTPPYDLKDRLTIWQRGDKPVHFLVTGTTVNLFCVIDDFTYYEQGGDVGTLHYSLTLREYKEVQARQVEIESPPSGASPASDKPAADAGIKLAPPPAIQGAVALIRPLAAARTDNRVQEKTCAVAAGDSLWGIAKKRLGDGGRYSEIAELNPDIKNPGLISPGQILRLPG